MQGWTLSMFLPCSSVLALSPMPLCTLSAEKKWVNSFRAPTQHEHGHGEQCSCGLGSGDSVGNVNFRIMEVAPGRLGSHSLAPSLLCSHPGLQLWDHFWSFWFMFRLWFSLFLFSLIPPSRHLSWFKPFWASCLLVRQVPLCYYCLYSDPLVSFLWGRSFWAVFRGQETSHSETLGFLVWCLGQWSNAVGVQDGGLGAKNQIWSLYMQSMQGPGPLNMSTDTLFWFWGRFWFWFWNHNWQCSEA